MRVLAGGLIAGIVLRLVPQHHGMIECLVAGWLLAFLLLQLGPRSAVERIGAALTVALLAWVAGQGERSGQSLFLHLLRWGAAGTALAFYLRPESE